MKRTWNHFFSAQFLGVFNDNLLKNLICFVAVLWAAEDQKASVIALASALMVLPFILLSPLAGKLAGKFPKAQIFRYAKVFEIPIVTLACVGFLIKSLPLTLLAMLLMGVQSAIYSPAKYGLIKELSKEGQVGSKLGTMEFLSFTAVLIGALVAGFIADLGELKNTVMTLLMIILALVGWYNSRQILFVPVLLKKEEVSINPIQFFLSQRKRTKAFLGVNNAILGMGVFWFIASLLQMNLLIYCPQVLGLSNTQTGLVSAIVAVGIGVGCFVSGRFNKKRVALGMLFPAMLGLGICVILMFFTTGIKAFLMCLTLAAFFGGLFKIPLNTWIQEKTNQKSLGSVLGFSNMVVFISILISALVFALAQEYFTASELFLGVGIFTLLVALVTLLMQPIALLRGVVMVVAKLLYRFRIQGLENVPKDKGAILVCNHVSMLDSLVLLNSTNRNVRFVMHDAVYHHRLLNGLFKKCKMIPVLSGKSKTALIDFTKRVKEQVYAGHLVCIFPEGQLARTGQLMSFKKGIEHLVKNTGAPVLPVHIHNMQGTPLSYAVGVNKRYSFHLKNWRKKVFVQIGELMTYGFKEGEEIGLPVEPSAFGIRQKVKELEVTNIARFVQEQDKEKAAAASINNITQATHQNPITVEEPLSLVIQSPDFMLKDLMKRENLYVGTKENMMGKPIPGVHVKILNDNLQPCRPLEKGSLYILNAYAQQLEWVKMNVKGWMDECGFVSYNL